jgi:hypothetical protein
MTRVTVDSEFWGKLNNPQGPVELCDPIGRTLGYLYPAPAPLDRGGGKVVSPFSDEELLRREQEPGGRSLEEILRDLSRL